MHKRNITAQRHAGGNADHVRFRDTNLHEVRGMAFLDFIKTRSAAEVCLQRNNTRVIVDQRLQSFYEYRALLLCGKRFF